MKTALELSRSAALTGYLDLARSVGLDPYRIVAAEGLPATCLTDPDLKVSADAVVRVLERSAKRSGMEDFGLRLAETRRLSNLGAIGLLAREQPTLRAALQVLSEHQRVQTEALSLTLEEDGEIAIYRASHVRGIPSFQALDVVVGVTVRTVRALVGQDWRPQGVSFTHRAPGDTSTHRRVLGVTPLFEQPFTGVVMLARELDAPVVGADPETRRHMERYLAQVAGRHRVDAPAVVRALILEMLPSGQCSIQKVAARLRVHRRTLHRQLAVQDTTFARLLDEARFQLAEAHIAEGRQSLTQISELLGYSSLSAFSRWYRRHAAAANAGSKIGGAEPLRRQVRGVSRAG
jgi:AraC-like DNA-binding protein